VCISLEPLELRKIFCRDDRTKGVCKLDDLSPYGYNFSICRKELITPLYCWKDVLYAWKSVIEKDENKDWTNFLANTVWLNKQVKIYKRTIFYPEWFNRGVKFVNDFVNDDGSFLTCRKTTVFI
jgi:hypothetical protein